MLSTMARSICRRKGLQCSELRVAVKPYLHCCFAIRDEALVAVGDVATIEFIYYPLVNINVAG